MKKIINFFNKNKKAIIYGFLILLVFFVIIFGYYKCSNHWKAQKIEYVDSTVLIINNIMKANLMI